MQCSAFGGLLAGTPVSSPHMGRSSFSSTLLLTSSRTMRSGRHIELSVQARRGGGGGGNRFRGNDNRGRRDDRPTIPMNEMIRAPEVRVLTALKEPLGVMSTMEALNMARDEGVDLICVVPDASPPVCRLITLSKYNYELTKAAKDAKKKQREAVIETKELKLRPATDVHDYQVKVRAAQKFLAKGARVKLTVQFKGREMEFKDIGRDLFTRFLEDLGGDEAITIEAPMQMQGRQMNMVLAPKKELVLEESES